MTEEKGMPRYWEVETETGLQASQWEMKCETVFKGKEV
jgi:hypothetical protein